MFVGTKYQIQVAKPQLIYIKRRSTEGMRKRHYRRILTCEIIWLYRFDSEFSYLLIVSQVHQTRGRVRVLYTIRY